MISTQQGIFGYHCSQLFGYRANSEKLLDEDLITSLRFDPQGKMLAVGDRAGRIIIFAATQSSNDTQYQYLYQFQAHDREFDTLKNLSISEEIAHINWLRPQQKYNKMLTTNSNTIRLWRFYQHHDKKVVKCAGSDLHMPLLEDEGLTFSLNLKQVFPNKQLSPLNSISISVNEEYILSTDEAHAFIWSIEKADRPFVLGDICKASDKKLQKTEKITCSQMHPQCDDLFIYGTNKGLLGLNDLRTSITNCNSISFQSKHDDSNFLSEIINKYSAVLFVEGTRQIITRDLLSLKIWDMGNNKQPIFNQCIDPNLKSKLCDLFEADHLDDKFTLSHSHNQLLTGNYSNSFHLIDASDFKNCQYEMDYDSTTHKRQANSQAGYHNPFDLDNRVLAHDFNSITKQIAASTHNSFFIYSAP